MNLLATFPRYLARPLAALGLLLLCCTGASAQLTGTKTIPGDYASLAQAIAALNSQGVGAGGVRFNIAAGYVETLASPGAGAITATGTSANPIVFQKSGSGANPLITAGVGTTSLDAIIGLQGSDYVTFTSLDLLDAPGNTTVSTAMEFGYALFRNSNTDGCQHITIQNCTVTLNRSQRPAPASSTDPGYPIGIYSANSTASSATSLSVTGATAAGTNSNNAFYGNTITNVQSGIVLNSLLNIVVNGGVLAAIYYPDQNSDVGGSSAATGNTVANYGGLAVGADGILLTGQDNSNVSYNTITNSVPATNGLHGIFSYGALSGNYTFRHNTATLVAAPSAGQQVFPLQSSNGGTGVLTIEDNTLSVTTTANGAASSNDTRLLVASDGNPAAISISGNTLALTLSSTAANSDISGTVVGIYSTQNTTGNLALTNNTLTLQLISTGTSTVSLPVFSIYTIGTVGGNATFSGNNLTLNRTASAGNVTSALYGLYANNSVSGTATFSTTALALNQTASGTGSITGSTLGLFNASTVSSAATFTNNTIQLTQQNSGSGTLSGTSLLLYNAGTLGATATFTNNSLAGTLSNTGTGTLSTALNALLNEGNISGAASISSNTLTLAGTRSSGTYTSSYQGITNTGSVGGDFTLSSNTLLGSTNPGPSLQFVGTTGTVTGTYTASSNRLENATVAGTVTGLVLGGGNTAGTKVVTGNTVKNISAGGSITALEVDGTKATITRNQVYTLKSTGTAGAGVRGLVLNPGAGVTASDQVYNNAIGDLTADGGPATSNGQILGIGVLSGTGFNLYNNSVQLTGDRAANGLSGKVAAALYVASGVTGLDVRNNILSNVQTTSDAAQPGTNYAVYAAAASGSPFTTIDYNLYDLRSGASTAGMPQFLGRLAGANVATLAAWQTATGQDRSSMLSAGTNTPGFTSATNLVPNPADANAYILNGTGVQLAAVATDLAGTSRPTTVAAGAPDLGAYEVTPTATPNPLAVSGAPALGGTQTFSLNGRPLAVLTYGNTGTVPSSVVARYYPGTTPPAPLGAGINYQNAYLTFADAASNGTGYTYTLTTYYDPALLGTISNASAQQLAQRRADGSGYVPVATTVNTTARTLTSRTMLSRFDLVTANDAPVPLPTLTSFTPTSGLVGTTLTLNGTNLAGATVITFAGTSANTVSTGYTISADGTSITGVVVPTGAATGSISVTTPVGTASTSGLTPAVFTVTLPVTAAPVVTQPANNSITNNAPSFLITATPGSVLEVYLNGQSLGTYNVGSNGFILAHLSSLAEATYTLYATAQSSGATISANSNLVTFTVDATAPTVTAFTSPAGTSGSTSSTTPLSFSVTFSEPVTGFSASGITVTNGTVTNGSLSGSGSGPYTFTVTPTTAGTATTVTIAANAAQDAVGNGNTASSSYSFTYVAPVTATTWTAGAGTQDWFTAGNWSAGVPTASTDALIPAGVRFYPIIGSGAAATRALTITSPGSLTQSAGTLTVNGNLSSSGTISKSAGTIAVTGSLSSSGTLSQSGGDLTIGGSLTNNSGGTITQVGGTIAVSGSLTNNSTFITTNAGGTGGGTVLLGSASGSASSTILGSVAIRFWNLTVQASGAQLSTSAGASVRRVLTLTGSFATNGNLFTLESASTGDAVVVNTGGAVVGTATVQRYITPSLNPGLGYRHYSAPVSNSTVADLATSGFTPVVNPAYNTSPTPTLVAPFPTVYGYDDSRLSLVNNLAPFDKGYFSPATLSDPLAVGRGYTVNIAASELVDFQGTLNNGPLPLPLTSTRSTTYPEGGWQLLGNPYPAPLDYSRVDGNDRLGLEAAIYVYQSTSQYAGQYRSYINGIGNPVLPLGQAFFTRVAAGVSSATMTFRNAQRLTVPNSTTFQRTTTESRPLVQLTLQGSGSPLLDEATVYFESGASSGFDPSFDAQKLPNLTGLNLSTSLASGPALSIDGQPELGTSQRIVPLSVGVPTPGSYTLAASQLLNLSTVPVYLRDRQSGALIDLAQQPSYPFTVSNAAALVTGRFELVFSPQQVLTTVPAALAQQVSVYPNPANGQVAIELPAALTRTAVTATLVDALGRVVRQQVLLAGLATHTLPLANLATGVYALRLNTSAGMLVKKLVVE